MVVMKMLEFEIALFLLHAETGPLPGGVENSWHKFRPQSLPLVGTARAAAVFQIHNGPINFN